DVDAVLEDTTRRLRVFRQVAENLNRRGSLRSSDLDRLEADYFISQLEQFRTVVQAGRQQAYEALRHFVGVSRGEPLVLRQAALAPALTPRETISAYA